MPTLSSPLQIRQFTVRNRVTVPPMVVCGHHRDGQIGMASIEHYGALARGGAGILIQEATCVLPKGKLHRSQLGLWDDSQMDGCRRIADACLPYRPLLLVQLHYASEQGEPGRMEPIGPSEYTNQDGFHRALSTAEVERIRDGFIAAAVRAERAGYHGVELHGAHGYLLCAFQNPKLNRRYDRYGDPAQLAREIHDGIRQVVEPGFILAMRMGADNPDLPSGIAMAKALEAIGYDILHVSSGMAQVAEPSVPAGFPFPPLVWRGCEIKKHVGIPVIAVGGLDTPGLAGQLIAEGRAAFAAIGRGQLVDPEWANKTLRGESPNRCLNCRNCVWFEAFERCPARKKYLAER